MRIILPGIRALVFVELGPLVITSRHGRAQERSKPVDPVMACETAVGDGRAEGAGWVQGAAGEEDTYWKFNVSSGIIEKHQKGPGTAKGGGEDCTGEFGDEEREPHRHWRHECGLVFLGAHEQDGDDQLDGQEHFNE